MYENATINSLLEFLYACMLTLKITLKTLILRLKRLLRVLTALEEDLGSIPSTHMLAYSCLLTPVPGDSTLLVAGARMVHSRTCRQNTHKINTFKKLKQTLACKDLTL